MLFVITSANVMLFSCLEYTTSMILLGGYKIMSHSKASNRLIDEKSPYLLQHANNPVDWYPWGEEAFAKANADNKPIFLSIGYSTCHWCHSYFCNQNKNGSASLY